MLTAAHVVAGAVSVAVRDPDKREYSAMVDPRFVGDVDGPGPDLALLEIDDPAFEHALQPVGLAAVDRDSASGEPVERCHAVGYPWFAETRSRIAVRDTVDAIGVVPVLSKLAAGLLSVLVTVAPRALPPKDTTLGESEWAGMSGAPVFAAGCLLGVVIEHAAREGSSAVTAVPLTALQSDPAHEQWGSGVADPAAWWSRLGVDGIGALQRLPVPLSAQPEPAYRATLREFGRALHRRMPQLLGRQEELAQIAAFATSGAGYRWLVGRAFTGKSALLYEAVTVGLPNEVDVVCYFLSRRASDAAGERFLAAVVPQLAYLCDVDPPVANVDQYRALWERAAARATQTRRHLLLVVDGLDEDLRPPGSPSVASLLPALVGARAHVLVASRPRPELPDDVPDGHPLKETGATDLDPFEGAQQLAELARQEIHDLTHGDDADLAVDVFGVLTAAAGPLSLRDLVALRSDGQEAPTAAYTRRVRRLVEDRAARSLERVGPTGNERYQFAHVLLLEYAQADEDLHDPEYRQRIHHWTERWRDAGWPTPSTSSDTGTPRYLLDHYPATLASDPDRLAALAGDIGWAAAAVPVAGVEQVLADLDTAASSRRPAVSAMLAVIAAQTSNLRSSAPVDRPGYVIRQLCLQAMELRNDDLADTARTRLRALADPGPVPLWTTRRASQALALELGTHNTAVFAVAVLPDGRVVTGGNNPRVMVWDPSHPGAAPVQLGTHDYAVRAAAVLPDGRVVTGGDDHRVMVWDPGHPGAAPVQLGTRDDPVWAVAVLPDGRVVGGGAEGRVLVWDPGNPGAAPVQLGTYDRMVEAVAVFPDGRVVTSGDRDDPRVLVWDPGHPGAAPVQLGTRDDRVSAVAVLPDGRVVTGGAEGRVLVWDPGNPGAAPVQLGTYDRMVLAVAVFPDGRVVTSGGGVEGRVLVWDPGHPGAAPVQLGTRDDPVWAVGMLPDGRVVTGGIDGRVLVWDLGHPSIAPAQPGSHDVWVSAVAALGDGRMVTGGGDGRVLVWDPGHPGAAPVQLGTHDRLVWAVAVLPDGRVVTSGAEGRVLVWDPGHPGIAPVQLGSHGSTVLAVLPDGRVVTSGGGDDGRVLVWDPGHPGAAPVQLSTGQHLLTVVAALGDGRVVVIGFDGRVLVWDPGHPGAAPVQLGTHYRGPVRAAAVLGDGRLVTCGAEGRVLVWDPGRPGGAPVELEGHDGTVRAVAALPERWVVTGGDDRRVLVWNRDTGGRAAEIRCSASGLAACPRPAPGHTQLVIAHEGGLSGWSMPEALTR